MLLETLVESQKAVKELQAKVQQLGTVEPETAEERNVSGTQQLIAKFTKLFTQKANTPTMSVGMSFSKYKFSIESWQRVVDIPKKDQAVLLVNSLPDNDYYGRLIEIVAKNIGWSAIQCEQGIENVLAELDKIIRSPNFVRLMQWEKKWAELKQGLQSFERHILTLRQMVRDAEEDFKFVVPAKMIASKMLLSCSAVTPENIGNITANIELAGDDRNINSKVEKRLKQYCSTVQQLGAQQNYGYVLLAEKDVFGHDIGGQRGSSEVLLNVGTYKKSRKQDLIMR